MENKMTQREAVVKSIEVLSDPAIQFAEKEEVLKRLEKIRIQLENKAAGGKVSPKKQAEKAEKANFASTFFSSEPQRLKDIISLHDELRLRFSTVQSLLGAIRPLLEDGTIVACKENGEKIKTEEKVKEKFFRLA